MNLPLVLTDISFTAPSPEEISNLLEQLKKSSIEVNVQLRISGSHVVTKYQSQMDASVTNVPNGTCRLRLYPSSISPPTKE